MILMKHDGDSGKLIVTVTGQFVKEGQVVQARGVVFFFRRGNLEIKKNCVIY